MLSHAACLEAACELLAALVARGSEPEMAQVRCLFSPGQFHRIRPARRREIGGAPHPRPFAARNHSGQIATVLLLALPAILGAFLMGDHLRRLEHP